MGSRRQARIIAVQALYGWDMCRTAIEDALGFEWLEKENASLACLDFARLLTAGTIDKLDQVDETIKTHLEHWDFKRLSRVDLAILRMSVYCLLFQQDIPASVTIDEAIDISKDFGADDSYRFINGVLDGIRKTLLRPYA